MGYFRSNFRNPETDTCRASHGAASKLFANPSASSSGVLPLASIAARVPVAASSIAPRATVRDPSDRTSTISRATTGSSSEFANG